MPGKPKIEERNRDYRQQQCDPDWQTNPEIKNQIDDHPKQGGNSIVNCKNGQQVISRLSFVRIPAFWASIERFKPILQRASLVPRARHRPFAARCTFPVQSITDRPKKKTNEVVSSIRLL